MALVKTHILPKILKHIQNMAECINAFVRSELAPVNLLILLHFLMVLIMIRHAEEILTMPLLARGVHLKPTPGCAATEQRSAAAGVMPSVMTEGRRKEGGGA